MDNIRTTMHVVHTATKPTRSEVPPELSPEEVHKLQVDAMVGYLHYMAQECADTMAKITTGVQELQRLGITEEEYKDMVPAIVWGIAAKVEKQQFGTA